MTYVCLPAFLGTRACVRACVCVCSARYCVGSGVTHFVLCVADFESRESGFEGSLNKLGFTLVYPLHRQKEEEKREEKSRDGITAQKITLGPGFRISPNRLSVATQSRFSVMLLSNVVRRWREQNKRLPIQLRTTIKNSRR